jgi:hypothetical protein
MQASSALLAVPLKKPATLVAGFLHWAFCIGLFALGFLHWAFAPRLSISVG